MNSDLHQDLAPTYCKLVFSEANILAANIGNVINEPAHRPLFDFHFDLLLRNFDIFNRLFRETSSVEAPGDYLTFINEVDRFIQLIQAKRSKSYFDSQDNQEIHAAFIHLDHSLPKKLLR